VGGDISAGTSIRSKLSSGCSPSVVVTWRMERNRAASELFYAELFILIYFIIDKNYFAYAIFFFFKKYAMSLTVNRENFIRVFIIFQRMLIYRMYPAIFDKALLSRQSGLNSESPLPFYSFRNFFFSYLIACLKSTCDNFRIYL